MVYAQQLWSAMHLTHLNLRCLWKITWKLSQYALKFLWSSIYLLLRTKLWSTRIGWNSNLLYLWIWPYFEKKKKKSLLMTELMWVPYREPHPTWLCPDKQRKFWPRRRMWRRRAKIGVIGLLIKAEAQGCLQPPLPVCRKYSKHLPQWLLQCRDSRDVGSVSGSGRSPEDGHGNPLQYSCRENPMDRVWWAMIHGVAKSDMTKATEHIQ